MLLLGCENGSREELQRLAMQVSCRVDDMIPAPNVPGVLTLPIQLLPAVAVELFNCFYNRERETIYTWAKKNGLLITKKAKLGPQIVRLRGGSISCEENLISFSIVVPSPHGDEPRTGEMTAAEGRQVAVRNKFAAQSRPILKVGDVIILEGGEGLAVSGAEDRVGEVQEICLVSAVHVAKSVEQDKGGWDENMEEAG